MSTATQTVNPRHLENLVTSHERRTGQPVRRTPYATVELFLDTLDELGYQIVRSRTRNDPLTDAQIDQIEAAMGAAPRAAVRRCRFKAGVTVAAIVAALAGDRWAVVAPGDLD